MTILLLGSGGREHAFAWKILQSSLCSKLCVAPGNAGTASIAENVSLALSDFQAIKEFVLSKQVTMVVVGPEDPLVLGLYDYFKKDALLKKIPVIGPSQQGAMLEGSKDFAKAFLSKYAIPTAAYKTFTSETLAEGFDFIETLQPPYVLKADGLAAGKGVLILHDRNEARQELQNMLVHAKFGTASSKVVIEEFLDGIELSCFVLTDGKNYKILPTAKDYKRIGEGDTGLNTGGMGAISPVPFVDEVLMDKIESQIIKPTIFGLQNEGIEYKGFIFIGLIIVNGEPKVIEYNVRMGDPETEVVIPRITSDLVALFDAVVNEKLDLFPLEIDSRSAATVMLVSGGYPEHFEKHYEISGLEQVTDALIFHAGTIIKDDKIVTNGGRVIAITSFGNHFSEATKKSYQNIAKLHFDKMYFRNDIGFDLL
ncbi:phosphoribosylamine--glycine ligase [Flavobacterium aciduliphilum]|uniref:Phosphoribosylamine--glycine ligase n=1 Tax=Flavobacterium aciduliphilum TaxID=1101402 RepID=A0A328YIN4_9FLAO|nr:phosphoribosylamine--glycine ligase [Flavobacterium aciduliphilum]RAR72913.1 phosphoribosylamine--glycine ligase [Flavobacterium aciduliphilum]